MGGSHSRYDFLKKNDWNVLIVHHLNNKQQQQSATQHTFRGKTLCSTLCSQKLICIAIVSSRRPWSSLVAPCADQPCHAPKMIVDGKSVFAIATTTITFTIPLPLSLKSRVEWNFLARCVVMVKFRAIKIRYLLCDKRSKIGRFVAEILFILSREHASVL